MKIEKIGAATLYLADCMAVLPTLPRVDAVITDPPYGINFAAMPTTGQRAAGSKKKVWDACISPAVYTAIEKGDVCIVWGGNYYALQPSRGWLVWHKPDAPPSMANAELAWTSMDRNTKQFSWSIGATNSERVGHPTQKPLALMKWCIEQCKGNPQTILDPFMGSGTTGVAAVQMGRQFIGIERDPEYFDIACERIHNAYRQSTLFGQDENVQEVPASAISDGRTCHSRIEQAYAQPRLFEDAQRISDMFAHEARDAYEITDQQASLLEGL